MFTRKTFIYGWVGAYDRSDGALILFIGLALLHTCSVITDGMDSESHMY